MTVETTGLFKAIEDATKVEGYRRSQMECSLVSDRLQYRAGFYHGAHWALEQGIVQEMVEALEGLEWAAMPRGHGNFCPSCQRQDAEEGGPGHTADCSLALLLARIRGQETTDDE